MKMNFTKDNDLLIVPDVHGRAFWREPVLQGDYAHVVFLGDYTDPYPHEYISPAEAMSVFEEIVDFAALHPEKVTLLLGNHDMHYVSPLYGSIAQSSRYNYALLDRVNNLYQKHKELFALAFDATYEGVECLLTHAGVSEVWLHEHRQLVGAPTADNINSLADSTDGILALADVGYERGGWALSGSPLWADCHEVASSPLPDDGDNVAPFQIFGHTQMGSPRPLVNRHMACLDCQRTFMLSEVLDLSGRLS